MKDVLLLIFVILYGVTDHTATLYLLIFHITHNVHNCQGFHGNLLDIQGNRH